MASIWTICIEYDYGAVEEAGFFTEEEPANAWAARHSTPYTTFYAHELEPATEISMDTTPTMPMCEERTGFVRIMPCADGCGICTACEWWKEKNR